MRFSRLFELAVNKSSSVAHMSSFGWKDEGAAWKWRRRLWACEEEMSGECVTLVHSVSL